MLPVPPFDQLMLSAKVVNISSVTLSPMQMDWSPWMTSISGNDITSTMMFSCNVWQRLEAEAVYTWVWLGLTCIELEVGPVFQEKLSAFSYRTSSVAIWPSHIVWSPCMMNSRGRGVTSMFREVDTEPHRPVAVAVSTPLLRGEKTMGVPDKPLDHCIELAFCA